jgi:hypothetical protein
VGRLKTELHTHEEQWDYHLSQRAELDISEIKTVCLTLGPYRNLTTLTAAIIALHPKCQVLNHASDRILSKPPGKMLLNYSDFDFKRFVKFAVFISKKGRRGRYGGSITLSHAFDHDVVRQKYERRYGQSLIKKNIRCLFWKESMRLTNYIRENQISLSGLISKNSKLKFLMPIRNPLDCAISNLKSGHAKYFRGLKSFTVENVLDSIIREISWFLDLRQDYPDSFFCYVQNEFSEKLLLSLANFLRIQPDEEWIHDSLECFRLKKAYKYEAELVTCYRRSIETYLAKHPAVGRNLSSFT